VLKRVDWFQQFDAFDDGWRWTGGHDFEADVEMHRHLASDIWCDAFKLPIANIHSEIWRDRTAPGGVREESEQARTKPKA
jgi:hypothetical protein